MTKKETQSLVKVGGQPVAALEYMEQAEGDPQKAAELILAPLVENLGMTSGDEADLGPLRFPRVTIPTGGSESWLIPSAAGARHVEEITGFVIAFKPKRGFWLSENITGEPPDCRSSDGRFGLGYRSEAEKEAGTPTKLACRKCPHDVWGSALGDRKGKRCKERRWAFVLPVDSVLPILLSVSPGSLKVWEDYMMLLAQDRIRYWEVKTSIKLQRIEAQPPYSQIHLSVAGKTMEAARLDAKQVEFMARFREPFVRIMAEAEVEEPEPVDANEAATAA